MLLVLNWMICVGFGVDVICVVEVMFGILMIFMVVVVKIVVIWMVVCIEKVVMVIIGGCLLCSCSW